MVPDVCVYPAPVITSELVIVNGFEQTAPDCVHAFVAPFGKAAVTMMTAVPGTVAAALKN